jgi:hypothetical protein
VDAHNSELGYIKLTRRGGHKLGSYDMRVEGKHVPAEVQSAVDYTISTSPHRGWRESQTFIYDRSTPEKQQAFDAQQASEMGTFFRQNPDVEALRVVESPVLSGGFEQADLVKRTWLVNIAPVAPIHVIVHDDDIDYDKPLTIEQINEDPVRFHADPTEAFSALPAVNPHVKIYRLRNRRP